MSSRRIATALCLAVAFLAPATTTASADEVGGAGEVGVQTCWNTGRNSTIAIRSCNWNVTMWRTKSSRTGHFLVWDYYNPNNFTNSPDIYWILEGFPNSNQWNMGAPWSNVTCAQFYRNEGGGRWTAEGPNQCNHDA